MFLCAVRVQTLLCPGVRVGRERVHVRACGTARASSAGFSLKRLLQLYRLGQGNHEGGLAIPPRRASVCGEHYGTRSAELHTAGRPMLRLFMAKAPELAEAGPSSLLGGRGEELCVGPRCKPHFPHLRGQSRQHAPQKKENTQVSTLRRNQALTAPQAFPLLCAKLQHCSSSPSSTAGPASGVQEAGEGPRSQEQHAAGIHCVFATPHDSGGARVLPSSFRHGARRRTWVLAFSCKFSVLLRLTFGAK